MKLTNIYTGDGGSSVALLDGNRALDLMAVERGYDCFRSVAHWLRGGEQARQRTLELLEEAKKHPQQWQAFDSLRLAPLVDRDVRIFCVGLNYADHAAENNLAPPSTPVFFSKLASVSVPHGAAVVLPKCSVQVDYEAEFAFMIGKRAKSVAVAEALIAGYTIMNDVSARDMQFMDQQWFRGKNCDTFAPLGPWLVPADEIESPGNLKLELRLNGKTRQRSNTSQLVFGPAALLSYLSQSLTLEPGDVISTGTPGGIGYYASPKLFLQPGDIVEIEIERIGTLRNAIAA